MLSYFQAIILGLLQGVTELFPISSLGHTVLLPTILGWHSVVQAQQARQSYYLAFVVGLHVATALALIIFFRKTWIKIVGGILNSVKTRKIETPYQRLGWLLILGTIPAGLVGLIFEKLFRSLFAHPLAAAIFLMLNGIILIMGEKMIRNVKVSASLENNSSSDTVKINLSKMSIKQALFVGSAQILALFAGISRSGVTMVAGLKTGLDHEEAAQFSFLLATPIILAAGVYKLPLLFGPAGKNIIGPVVVGSLVAGVAAYLSVKFLVAYFEDKNLIPFAIYSLIAGALAFIYFV